MTLNESSDLPSPCLDVLPSTQESYVISDLIHSHASSRLPMDSKKCTSELHLSIEIAGIMVTEHKDTSGCFSLTMVVLSSCHIKKQKMDGHIFYSGPFFLKISSFDFNFQK